MERRSGARIRTAIFVAIEGIDAKAVPRQGNISASGLYLELEVPLGAVGTVQWLRLSSLDLAQSVGVMAHVVRTMTFSDIVRGNAYGVALEFMPESEAASHALQEFVLYVLARKLSSTALTRARQTPPPPPPSASVQVARAHSSTASSSAPLNLDETVRALDIETSRQLPPSEALDVWIRAEGSEVRYRAVPGRSVRIGTETGEIFRTSLELTKATDASNSAASEEQLGDLLARYVVPPDARRPESRSQFEGLLSRVKLPTLLSLIEMDRMTGKLVLSDLTETTSLYVKDGRVLDATSTAPGEPREVIRRALGWKDGTFSFRGGDVDGPDRLGQMPTTVLLLDLVRELDESQRFEDFP